MNQFRPTITVRDTKVDDKIVICADGMFGHNEMVLPISHEQFTECYNRWQAGDMVQHAFPSLDDEQREFLLTGMPIGMQEEFFDKDK